MSRPLGNGTAALGSRIAAAENGAAVLVSEEEMKALTAPAPAPAKGATLLQRINRIKSDVVRLGKDSENKGGDGGFRFRFTGVEVILDLIRPLCVRHGVTVLYHGPDPALSTRTPTGRDRKPHEGIECHYCLWAKYTLANTDDPSDTFDVMAMGEAIGKDDKCWNKCQTSAAKNFYLRVFDISTGDPDPDEETGGGDQPRRDNFNPDQASGGAPPAHAEPTNYARIGEALAKELTEQMTSRAKSLADLRAAVNDARPEAMQYCQGPLADWPRNLVNGARQWIAGFAVVSKPTPPAAGPSPFHKPDQQAQAGPASPAAQPAPTPTTPDIDAAREPWGVGDRKLTPALAAYWEKAIAEKVQDAIAGAGDTSELQSASAPDIVRRLLNKRLVPTPSTGHEGRAVELMKSIVQALRAGQVNLEEFTIPF